MARVNKTTYRHDWVNGHYKQRSLTRSFETMDEAERFAEGKDVVDIYRRKGKYTVEWMKKEVME